MSVPPPNIVPNRDGTLRDDCLYELAFTDEPWPWTTKKAIISQRNPAEVDVLLRNEMYITFEIARGGGPDALCVDCHEGGNCPHDVTRPHHAASVYFRKVPSLVVCCGDQFAPLTSVDHGDWGERAIVTDLFARQLPIKAFSGIDLVQTTIAKNESEIAELPRLWLWQPKGFSCKRPMKILDRENLCPFCRAHVVVCEECGHLFFSCPKCERDMYDAKPHEPEDKRLLLCDVRERPSPIIDGSRWDGSDCFASGGGIGVTRRVVDFLLSIHAAPFIAEPCPVWIDNMSKEQLARLEDAKRPVKP